MYQPTNQSLNQSMNTSMNQSMDLQSDQQFLGYPHPGYVCHPQQQDLYQNTRPENTRTPHIEILPAYSSHKHLREESYGLLLEGQQKDEQRMRDLIVSLKKDLEALKADCESIIKQSAR